MRLAGVLAVVAACLVVALTSDAGAASPSCVQSGLSVTCTYGFTGAEQSLAVPAGVTSVNVDAVGAPGGSNGQGPGGNGGTASITLPVTPGSTLFVEVGGPGTDGGGGVLSAPGGWNGGGDGGAGLTSAGGGGGGASDVRTLSCGASCPGSGSSLASRLVIAAGGGGRGGVGHVAGGAPGDAGSAGQNGSDDTHGDQGGRGGGAATDSAGGTLGTGGINGGGGANGDDGSAGDLGVGGIAGSEFAGGGGGGGGLYGGGGAGGAASSNGPFNDGGGGGGGGGFSFAPGGITGVAAQGTAPSVTVTYTLPPPPITVTPPSPPSVSIAKPANGAKLLPGQQVKVDYTCTEGPGGPGITSCSGPVASGQKLKAGKPGTHSFTVTAKSGDGLSTTKTVSYKVVKPSKKKGLPVTLTLNYKKGGKSKPKRVSFQGVIASNGGGLKTVLPFKNVCVGLPGTCSGDDFGPTGEFALRATPRASTRRALERRVGDHSSRSATLTVKESSLHISYTLHTWWVKKISRPSLARHGNVLVLSIVYESLELKSCSPSTSC